MTTMLDSCAQREPSATISGESSVLVSCDYCGKEIKRTPCELKHSNHSFCNLECRVRFFQENRIARRHWRHAISEGQKSSLLEKVLKKEEELLML